MSITLIESTVRISDNDKEVIRDAVEKVAKNHNVDWSQIGLFGSRINSQARGGDIDLYIRLKTSPSIDLFRLRQDLRLAVIDTLGDQKLDIVLDYPEAPADPFLDMVRSNKVDIWKKE